MRLSRSFQRAILRIIAGAALPAFLLSGAVRENARPDPTDELRRAYFDLQLDSVVAVCADLACDALPRSAQLLRVRAQSRRGRADLAQPWLKALRGQGPDDAAVLLTAAIVHHGLAQLAEARRLLDRALAAPGAEAEAWLEDAQLRLMEQDAAGAATSYGRAVGLDPLLAGSTLAYYVGRRVGMATGDARLLASVSAARLRAREARGLDPTGSREQERLYRAAASPLFELESTADEVEVPIVPCFDDSPYWCIALRVGGVAYQVLLDTGNQPGFTVHDPVLRDALATAWGPKLSVTTGSVDTALVSREFLVGRADFGSFSVRNLPAQFFPKPRERYFDANLNPFMLRGRVVTLDVPGRRLVLRTAERFRQEDPATRTLPVFGYDRFYVPATAAGGRALAWIETGAEEVAVTRRWAERQGLVVSDTTIQWRGRDYTVHRATVNVLLDSLPIGPARASVVQSFGGPPAGMAWEIMLGPEALKQFVLSFDPEQRLLHVSRPPRPGG